MYVLKAEPIQNIATTSCPFQFAFSHIPLTIVQRVGNFSAHINDDIMIIKNNRQVPMNVGMEVYAISCIVHIHKF